MQQRPRSAFVILALLLASTLPVVAPVASAEIVCCDSSEFKLHLVGENADATMTPFESELVGIHDKAVSQSVQGVEEIASWQLVWEHTSTLPEATWRFTIAYEVENAAGVHANATVEIKIGSTLYSGESGNPSTYMAGSGLVDIDVDIPARGITSGETIEVSFAVRSMLFTQPGDDTAIRFIWGEDTDSALRVDMPLLEIEMPNALIVGEEVFFPVILRSGFGDRMWTSLHDFEFKVGGMVITDVRSPSRVIGGVEVPFVWSPGASATDGVRSVNLSIWLNAGDVPIQSDRNHDIRFVEGGGGEVYEFGEPVRTAGSELTVDINVDYDGARVSRTVELQIEGAMAQWLRWGMDNIGNSTLPSDHFFKQVRPDMVPSSARNNGNVDSEEAGAFLNHLDSSMRNLEYFLDNGALALDPESLFEADLFDMNPEVSLDLMGVSGISSEPLTIRIDVVLVLSGQESLMLITDFTRAQLDTIWDNIDLHVTLSTSAFAGLYDVKAEGVEVTHYRLGLTEVVTIDTTGLTDASIFEVKYTVASSALFSPFVTLLTAILLLVTAIVFGLRMTRHRSRVIVSLSSFAFLGLVGYVYVLSSLPPTFVMVIAAACIGLMIPLALISPRRLDDDGYLSDGSLADDFETAMERVIPTVDCPACETANPVESSVRPLRIPCGGCGRNLRIET
jgi:hypothetical protein